jgi:hypothetical protein
LTIEPGKGAIAATAFADRAASALPERITVVKVFTSTTARARGIMGELVTAWLASHPGVRVIEAVVTASSDRQFHCLSIVLLCGGASLGTSGHRVASPTMSE